MTAQQSTTPIMTIAKQLGYCFDPTQSNSLGVPPTSFERQVTAGNMFHALTPFATRLVEFFDEGFKSSGKLKLSDCEPPDYVYALIAEQVAYDVDGILRAYSQRRIVETLEPFVTQIAMKKSLYFADRLGYQILTPAIVNNATRPATVFTYFQKSLSIRLIPYARVAFVGIPYSAMQDHNDYLALAHELGHYVYRYSQFDDPVEQGSTVGQYRKFIQEKPKWYAPWIEEIFADIFGCLFAGPRIAQSFQNLSKRIHARWFNADNGAHPAPVLRPYIYIDTLQELARSWNIDLEDVTAHLEESWQVHLRDETKVHLPGHECPLRLNDARKKICNEIISPILNEDAYLKDLVDALAPGGAYDESLFRRWWGTIDQWNSMFQSGNAPKVNRIEEIELTANEEFVPELTEVFGTNRLTVAFPPVMQQQAQAQHPQSQEEIELGRTNTYLDDRIDNINDRNPLEPEEWIDLLTFGGWIEKGPGGGHGHKT